MGSTRDPQRPTLLAGTTSSDLLEPFRVGLFVEVKWGPRRLFPIDFLIRPAWLWASQDASFRVLEHLLTPDPLEMVVAIWICCNDQAAMKVVNWTLRN